MSTIVLEEPILIREVQQLTEQEGLNIATFMAQAVRRHLASYRQQRIVAETTAWYNLPIEERKRYEGKFAAVYRGQVVDSDHDRLGLYYRLQKQYGRRPILIIEGGDAPIPVYRLRSPRRVSHVY